MGFITDRSIEEILLTLFFFFDSNLCSIVTFQDWREIGIFIMMIDEIGTMNMVLRGDNVVLRLLLERQDHAILLGWSLKGLNKSVSISKCSPFKN